MNLDDQSTYDAYVSEPQTTDDTPDVAAHKSEISRASRKHGSIKKTVALVFLLIVVKVVFAIVAEIMELTQAQRTCFVAALTVAVFFVWLKVRGGK